MPQKIGLIAKIILGSTAAGTVLLAVFAHEGPGLPADPSPAGEAAAAGGRSRVPAEESRFFRPEAGYRYTYSFRRGISFQGELGGAAMPPVSFAGEYYVDVLRADARAFEALLSERIQGSGPSPYLRIEADARGDQLHIFTGPAPGEEDKQHLSILKDLAALWLFPLRTDTVGAFEARFEPLMAEPGFAREKKAKLAYLSRAPNTPAIVSSQHYLLWSHELRLPKELKGAEATRLGSGKTALVAESRYEMLFASRSPSPAFSHELLASLRDNSDLALDTSSAPSMADHPDYAKLDWSALLTQLKGVDQLTGMQQLALFGDILKMLRMNPARAAELARLLRDPALLKAGASSALFKTIVGALASFGSPEALAALREAYDDPLCADSGRGTILAALTTTQAPVDSATREFLARKMESERDPRLGVAAAFALGSALQNAGNDSQAASAIAQIQARWDAAQSKAERLAMLDVMGNSGRTEFETTLKKVLHSGEKDAVIRARALFALRFVKSGSAAQELIAGLSSEKTELRTAAASAMEVADWSESFRAPLERCSGSEPNAGVLTSCRKTLTNHTQLAGAN